MTIAQCKAARKRMLHDPRWAKRGRKDPAARAKHLKLVMEREQARKQRTKK